MHSCKGHIKSKIRIAATWCIINLTWTEDPGAYARIEKLREIGVGIKLVEMLGDRDIDVKDRVKTALSHFQAIGGTDGMDDIRSNDVPTPGGMIDGRAISTDFLVMAHLAADDEVDF